MHAHHHIGYVVDDIAVAARHWNQALGAGPFTVLEHVVFDELLVDGEPVEVDHSTAFGVVGGALIELQCFHDIRPVSAARRLVGARTPGVSHVAIAAHDPAAVGADLTARGHPLVVEGRAGPIQVAMYDALSSLGVMIEVHRRGEVFDTMFADIVSAADGWDGRELLRTPGGGS